MSSKVHFQFAVVDHSVVNLRKMGEYINAGMETAMDIAEDVVQNEKDRNCPKAEDLKSVMLDYCRMERDLEQFLEAVAHVKAQALDDAHGDIPDLVKLLDDKLAEMSSANSDGVLASHEKYTDMLEKMSSLEEGEEQAETESVEKGGEEESEIAVTQQEINTKCPYTGLEMQRPVKNKHCGHTYDRDGINQFIKNRGRRAKCPVSGCGNDVPLAKEDLVENKEMKKYIDRKHRAAGKKSARK